MLCRTTLAGKSVGRPQLADPCRRDHTVVPHLSILLTHLIAVAGQPPLPLQLLETSAWSVLVKMLSVRVVVFVLFVACQGLDSHVYVVNKNRAHFE
jgi:hypothetical protein